MLLPIRLVEICTTVLQNGLGANNFSPFFYWHSYLIASLASKSFFADARSVIFVTNLVDSSSGVTVAPVTVRVVEVAVPALVTLPPGVVGLADTLTIAKVTDVNLGTNHVALASCRIGTIKSFRHEHK